jgi:hypothetical protein
MNINDMLIQLCEEAGEVTQAACKWQRFGPDSVHPRDEQQIPNKTLLAREIGNLLAIVQLLNDEGVDEHEVNFGIQEKMRKLKKYGYLDDTYGHPSNISMPQE